MKKQFSSTILRSGASLLTYCLLASAPLLRAQEYGTVISGTPPPGRAKFIYRLDHAGGEFGLVINGSDIGTILLKACDVDQDEKVTPTELKEVAAATFKLWDTNADGSVSGSELSSGLNALFPAPPPGGLHGARLINGVAVETPPDELVTPDAQVAKHILAGADSNKDGALTFQEVSAFLLGKFSQWDRDGSNSLDAQELNAAFGQLAKPPGRAAFVYRLDHAGGEFGLVINGSDIGTILLKACDADQDEKVTPAELEQVAGATFKLWDTNTDGSISGSELSTGLNGLFPAPPPGGLRGARLINGVAVEIPPDELGTPDAQVAKHILAGADSDKDGALTFQEVSAFLLGKFSQWDQDGSNSLDAQELNAAFGQLAKPD